MWLACPDGFKRMCMGEGGREFLIPHSYFLTRGALLAAVGQKRPTLVRKHLLEELLWAGGEESVAPVAKLLLDKELYEFASRTLVALKTPAPIRAALRDTRVRHLGRECVVVDGASHGTQQRRRGCTRYRARR